MKVVVVIFVLGVFAALPQHAGAQELSSAVRFVEVEEQLWVADLEQADYTALQQSSTDWRYAGWGILAGGVAGAVWGTVVMMNAEEWIAPPAHLFTVPVGMVVGGLVGWAIGTGAED